MTATFRFRTVSGVVTIECLLCGSISANRGDIVNHYCGRCHLFHDAVADGRRLLAAGGTHACGEWRTFRGACALCEAPLTEASRRP